MTPEVRFQDLGLIDYQEAWDYQEKLFAQSITLKIERRNGTSQEETKNYLLFCEHPHVYTLGKSGTEDHLLLNQEGLNEFDAKFYKINRGGDITYHGPGQLVAYPIFDLDYFFTDIHKYMRYLEEAVIQVLAHYGVRGERSEGLTGVWIDTDKPTARKICAMGVKSSRWVTMHGIGFNINSNLSYFSHIVPCGIEDKSVTSLQQELGSPVDMQEVKNLLKEKLASQFGFTYA
ncbi:lipoyl(octanoyl) transferase LipB [Fluviicola sp.]|jgi:lipoyl(octanoyl) transferase|uniref:lipoyl(octanoyl) transferase LipB n=1 Tax=Fluviicola sp. TaxID=1917219 RepID=UPI002825F930|nr:lipoyl(octanoyl) transferase LipB [Fluviicola sp.]MDR0802286.1 lipoyl(octanoyl) transferase LipB [Fluviicola sp.]